MSAIARYFNSRGVKVSGYDKTETTLTKQLVSEGIAIHYEDDVRLADKDAVFVVYTPAVPKDHDEYNFFLGKGYTILKRSEVLGMITRSSFNVCVAGTHGKTTTSTMVAHILRDSGAGCNAFLGGIASNYGTNFWSDARNICVAEADEYDRSFLQLSPDVAVITAMDPDHLDIYGDSENFTEAFLEFSGKVKKEGLLLARRSLTGSHKFRASKVMSYDATDKAADCHTENIKIINGAYHFDVRIKDRFIDNMVLNMGGMHNVENAVAAIAVAVQMNVDAEKIRSAVASFRGVKRRFEYIVKEDDMVFIDDYAHHPTELEALINGAKGLFPDRKCTVVFQPHLYSRTRDFAEGFTKALSLADEVLLLPIYPAREKPIPGVVSEMLLQGMEINKGSSITKQALLMMVEEKKQKGELSLLITAGAGDIDTMVEPIKKILTTRQ
jgi:UDP-N-acetylmuramate--alanine ligase